MSPIALLRWTTELLQLRGTPADAPPSPWLLVQLIVLDLISSVLYLQAIGREVLIGALLGRVMLRVAMIWAVLSLFRRTPRFVQSGIALYATGVLLTFILLPISAALVRSPSDSVDFGVQFLQLGFLSLLLWSIVVDAHIWRHSLSLKFWFALPLSLGLFMLSNELATRMFPLE